MNRLRSALGIGLPLAAAVTAICALLYLSVQQVLRQDANDPQIQMAEDTASALDRGAKAPEVISGQQVEFSKSLAPFVVVYDMQGKPTAGSGLLDGQLPEYPIGALKAARTSGENRVTWQPSGDVRVASVAVPYNGGYVVAGRNLREVEKREVQIEALVGAGWIATMLAIAAIVLLLTAAWAAVAKAKPQLS